MFLIDKLMPSLWLFSEFFALIFVKYWYNIFLNKKRDFNFFLNLCLILFVFLIILLLLGDKILSKNLDFFGNISNYLQYITIWNFFCTVWVMLEGLIIVHVIAICKLITYILKTDNNRNILFNKYKNKIDRVLIILIFSILILFPVIYFSYEYYLFHIYFKLNIPENNINRASDFYIISCGIFWIIFEGIVTFYCIKLFLILYRNKSVIK